MEKIKTVFGPTISVKLDLFHAVERITKTLSRKMELRLVFRCDGDSRKEQPLHMTDDKERKLFSPETITALKNLKHHVSAGCLSNIQPGEGTNRKKDFMSTYTTEAGSEFLLRMHC